MVRAAASPAVDTTTSVSQLLAPVVVTVVVCQSAQKVMVAVLAGKQCAAATVAWTSVSQPVAIHMLHVWLPDADNQINPHFVS